MGENQHPQSPKSRRSGVDLGQDGSFTKHTQSSPPQRTISQIPVSDSSFNTSSQPPSRSSSPSPQNSANSRHIQRTIDNYFQSPTLDNSKQLYEEARMQSDDISTSTQSTAPSECDSQDSERSRSSSHLKPPEPKRRRASTTRRAAGERDDGGCNLPSPPPPLLRPTTFWKNTPRSALGAPDYSPSTHLIRRSTWVAAGLETSGPVGDISALRRQPFTSGLVILIAFLYILGNSSLVMQASAYPWSQQIFPLMTQGVAATGASINWWPYTEASIFASPTTAGFNPIPIISLASSLSSQAGVSVLSTSTASSAATAFLYTTGNISSPQFFPQTIVSSTNSLDPAISSPSSVVTSVTPPPEQAGSPLGQINLLYFLPIPIILGAMLGASATVVLTRRCRRGDGNGSTHPFPHEGGFVKFGDTRDEQEKQWIASHGAFSEEEYETDSSDGTPSPRPQRTRQTSVRTERSPRRLSTRPTVSRQTFLNTKSGLIVSESFYDTELAETEALELNLSSDEEPPPPHAQIRGGSMRRTVLRNIDLEQNEKLQGHKVTPQLLRTQAPRIALVGREASSVLSPVQPVLSPRQMRDLFFVGHADLSRNQWVTAEGLLGGQRMDVEDSEEEDVVTHAILHAGANGRTGHPQDRVLFPEDTRVPTSLSALSTTAASRRLAKPLPSKRSSRSRRTPPGQGQGGNSEDETLSAPSGYGRIADIVSASWLQRNLASSYMSPTAFGSSLGSYDDDQAQEQTTWGRTVRFGLRNSDDGNGRRL